MIDPAPYAIGIDVGGTKIAGGIVALASGRVLHRRQIATRPVRGGAAVLADTAALAAALLEVAQAEGLLVRG
ncbi:MAG: ROK family protein, partial [Chloroflexales bacterium]|nr:ROK family protein [Chloroflexales bacterium]